MTQVGIRHVGGELLFQTSKHIFFILKLRNESIILGGKILKSLQLKSNLDLVLKTVHESKGRKSKE